MDGRGEREVTANFDRTGLFHPANSPRGVINIEK